MVTASPWSNLFPALEQARDVVRRQHRTAAEPLPSISRSLLEELLERLRSASDDGLAEVIAQLKSTEVLTLTHALPMKLEEELGVRVVQTLVARAHPAILSEGWAVLRRYPSLPLLWMAMNEVVRVIPPDQYGDSASLRRIARIFKEKNIDEAIVEDLQSLELDVAGWARSWEGALEVPRKSQLAMRTEGSLVVHGRGSALRREGLSVIEAWLDKIDQPRFEAASANYINQLNEEEWRDSRIEALVERFGLPARGGSFWERVDPEKQKLIQRKIAGRLIQGFFSDVDDPYGRFRFWEGYVDHLVDLVYPKGHTHPYAKERVLLDFDQLVVVEFRDLGNAGYIYPSKLRSWASQRVTSKRPHAECKSQVNALHRIIHGREWRRSTRDVLNRQLRRRR